MAKYYFTVEATITMTTEVEAPSLQAAIQRAQGRGAQSLCHQCARGDKRTWNTSGELDVDPTSSPLVSAGVGEEELDLEEVRKLWEGNNDG